MGARLSGKEIVVTPDRHGVTPPPMTTDQLRGVALRAKERYELFNRPEDQVEPTDTYKAWLREIGFTKGQVENWRSFDPKEA